MKQLKSDFTAKVGENNKKRSCYVEQLASFSELKNEVKRYLEDDSLFNKERNQRKVENFTTDNNMRFYGGTPDERANLTSYMDAERLQKVRDEVAADVQNLQIPDVRKRIEFHKNRHIFCGERYHAGHKKAFATRKQKRAPRPVVNIVLSMGYNCNIDAKDAAYNCLGGIVFADMLAKQGYAVNIYVVGAADYYSSGNCGINVVKAKDASTYLDADTLALLASDPRFFRHWVLQFNAISEDKRGREMQGGFGVQMKPEEIKDALQAAGLEYDFLFGQCFSHNKTVQQVREAVESLQEEQAA